MDIDTTLRDTFRAYSEHGPSAAGLLSGVRRRAIRQRHVRFAAAGVALAAMVGGLGTAVAGTAGGQPDRPVLTPATAARLVPAEYVLPTVPLSPGWVPDYAAEPYAGFAHTVLGEPGMWLAHDYRDAREGQAISLGVGNDPDLLREVIEAKHADAEEQPIFIRGRIGRLYESQDAILVLWEEAPQQWVTVTGDSQYSTIDDLRNYAESLKVEPFHIQTAVRVDLLPPELEPYSAGPTEVTFASDSSSLAISLKSPEWSANAGDAPVRREQIVVGGRNAELLVGSIATTVRIPADELRDESAPATAPAATVIEVTSSGPERLSPEDLSAVAATVRVVD